MKYFKLILIIFIIHSCQGQNEKSILGTTWYEVKNNGNDYYIIDCGYNNESFRIKNDSIYDYGIMEDSAFKIHKIIQNKDNVISLYITKNEKYDIFWLDKEKGIIKRTENLDGNSVKYFVNKINLSKIRIIKGNSENCITFDDEEEDNNQLKKWEGVYLNSDDNNLKTYKEITDRVGWYKLIITLDEIIYTNDSRINDDTPVSDPGGIYFENNCNYIISKGGDSITLYRKTYTHDDNSYPYKIKGNKEDLMITLFKKGDKYYATSKVIDNSKTYGNSPREKLTPPYQFYKFSLSEDKDDE